MEREIIGLIGIIALFLLLFFRSPVGLSMIVVGIGGNYLLSLFVPYLKFAPYLKQFKTLLITQVSNYDLSVIPLFLLMGYMASYANISRDLFQGFNALFGRYKGGVAMASVGACAGFGAVCGSSLATTSTMGKVALPELKRLKYAPSLASGTLAAGGTLGILIPPSIVLIIYALVVEASIIKMFQAAIIPGLMALSFFMITIALLVKFKPELSPNIEVMSKQKFKQAMLNFLPVIALFLSIILGLGLGIFTPTPAASVGVCFILFYGLFLRYKDKNKKNGLDLNLIKLALKDTAITTAMIFFILFGAEVLKGFFTRSNLPIFLAQWASMNTLDPMMVLILFLFILILLGFFMESLSMVLVVIPFFWPVLIEINGGEYITAAQSAFGVTYPELKIWFGILALIIVELGLITPPIGLNVFIIHSLQKQIPLKTIFLGITPFFCAEIFRVIILILFPSIILFLPQIL